MYIESVITDKAQAIALLNWKNNLLFYRDETGLAIHADKEKLESAWGMIEFFTCSYPNPVRKTAIDVKVLIGANAYACITHEGGKTDILLQAGKSAQSSLRQYAAEQRERAQRLEDLAILADRAADSLDGTNKA